MRVIIVGGGKVGSYLAEMLAEKHDVTVIEQSVEKSMKLEASLDDVNIIHGDGCEPLILEGAGVSIVDLVLAVTGDDEDNLVVSYLSKFVYEVPKVVARVNNPKNRWLFTSSWGVDIGVSTPDIIARIIDEEMTLGEVVTLMKLRASDVGLVEITLPDSAPAVGKRLSDLDLPPETVIVAVIREDAMLIPAADTVLQKTDRVLAITNINNEEALEQLLGSQA
ncbi:MAG: potassium channel family protein [Candidatus Geothermincolia bacterium]